MNTILTKNLLKIIFIIFFSVLFYLMLKQIISTTLFQKAKRNSNKKALTMITVTTNITKYIIVLIDILMILDICGIDTKALLTSLGIVGIVVGLALQDLLKDVIGGTAILTEDQFRVGDNIKVGDFRGDVIYLGLKTTKIRSYTGEVKIIANRNITEVINYSMKSSKCIIDIDTSYEDDIEKVKKALNKICEKLEKEVNFIEGKMELLGVEELKDSSICYRIVADTKPTYNIQLKRIFLEEVVKEFKKQNIEIPYPKVEVHHE